MRRRSIALVLILISLQLAGCWSRVEVNDLAIVSLMAIDLTDDGQLQTWLQIVVPSRASGQGGGGSGPRTDLPYITVTGKGSTLLDASRSIQLALPRRLFWAHTRVVLLGENLARSGVRPILDFLTRHRELRLTNYLMTVRGPLETLLAAPVDLDLLPAEYLREINRSQVGIATNVGDFARSLAARGADPITGVAEVIPPGEAAPEGQRPALKLAGSALYHKDRLVGYLDDRETRGVLWLRDEVQRGTITVGPDTLPGRVTMNWVRSKVKRSVQGSGGQVTIRIDAEAEADVGEQTTTLDLSDPKVLEAVERQMAAEVRERIELALSRMREANVDAAGLGELIHQQQPQVWKRLEKEWKQGKYQKTPVVVRATAHIRRTGLSNKPRGARDTELLKPD